jgi:hypothetical protein
VIKINGNDYRLVLLDTNALSEFSKHDESLRRFISWSMGPGKFVPCFSQFSILEVRHRADVYERFKRSFGILPCLMVKSHEQLLADEVDRYPDPSDIDPTLLGFSMVGGEGMDIDRVLEVAFGDEFIRSREKYWNDGRQGMVEGIASLVTNFPPEGDTYTPGEVRQFIEQAGSSQIAMRQATQAVSVNKQMVDIDASRQSRPPHMPSGTSSMPIEIADRRSQTPTTSSSPRRFPIWTRSSPKATWRKACARPSDWMTSSKTSRSPH